MKNQWFLLFFALFFFLGVASTEVYALDSDGGTELVIVISKTGETVYSFDIPKKYVKENGSLLLTAYLTIEQNGKQIYTTETITQSMTLPQIDGEYNVTLQIGDYVASYIVEK